MTEFISDLERLRAVWDLRAGNLAESPEDRSVLLQAGVEIVDRHVLPELCRLVTPLAEQSLLEVGCGRGRIVLAMAKHIASAHGVDISPRMLELARANCDGIGNIHLHLGDGMTLRCVRAHLFDAIVLHDCLSHFPDERLQTYVLRQVRYRLNPDGIALLQLDRTGLGSESISTILANAGLTLLEKTTDDGDLWVRAGAAGSAKNEAPDLSNH